MPKYVILLFCAIAFFSFGCSKAEKKEPEKVKAEGKTEQTIFQLLAELKKGKNDKAFNELVSMGKKNYDLFESEVLKNTQYEWEALHVLSRTNDKRAFLLFAKVLFSETSFTTGEKTAFVTRYLDSIVGSELKSFEEYQKWFDKNKEKMVWDEENNRFVLK